MSKIIVNGRDINTKIKEGTLLAHIADKSYNPNKDSIYSPVDYYCIFVKPYSKKDYRDYVYSEKQYYKSICVPIKDISLKPWEELKKYSKILKYDTGNIRFYISNEFIDLSNEGFFYVLSEDEKKDWVSKLIRIIHQI